MNLVQRIIARMSFIPLVEPTVKVKTLESAKLRLDEWRKSETLVLDAINLTRNGTYRAQLDVLRNEHPCHLVFAPTGINPNDRIAHQSKIEGYELCLNNLEAFARPIKSISSLVETFAEPETSKRK